MFRRSDIISISPLQGNLFGKSYIIKAHGKYYEMRSMLKNSLLTTKQLKMMLYEKEERSQIFNRYICKYHANLSDFSFVYFILDYPACGYLYSYLKELDMNLIKLFTAELIVAIQYLHKKNILYKLLIPENIMVDNKGHIKLRFDYCNRIGMSKEDFERNIEYISYDYLRYNRINKESDYWGIGIVLYEMVLGVTPFKGRDSEETRVNILHERLDVPIDLCEDLSELLENLLVKQPFKRLGFLKEDACLIRKMSFFSDINWNMLEKGEIKSKLRVKENVFYEKNTPFIFTRVDDLDGYNDLFKAFDNEKTRRLSV